MTPGRPPRRIPSLPGSLEPTVIESKFEPLSRAAIAEILNRRFKTPAPQLPATMDDLERWSLAAPAGDPLKRAFDRALGALRLQSATPEGADGPQLRAIVRNLRSVTAAHDGALHAFCMLYLREVVGQGAIDAMKAMPSDPEEEAFSRACTTWVQLLREFERVNLGPGGRPRSAVPAALNALHEEMQRSAVVGEDLKRRGIHAVAEWAAGVSGANADTLRRRIQEVRTEGCGNPPEL